MPKAASAAGAGTPVSGDHSNAIELSSPVEEENFEASGDSESESHQEGNEAEVGGDEGGESQPEIPTRLKGKSLAQVYQEFSGLEKEYSRQGNELGEARGLLRTALEQSLKQPGANDAQEEDPDPTDDEIIADPKGSVRKLVEKELKPLKQAVLTADQRAMMTEFNGRHPGYQQEVKSAEFQDWVKASPYRVRMFNAAAKFDMDAADDLFTEWGTVKAAKSAGDEGSEEERAPTKREAIKRTTTETGGAGKSAGSGSGKKIYKSSELMRLYTKDRERYNEMMPEIQKAFAEGRVR